MAILYTVKVTNSAYDSMMQIRDYICDELNSPKAAKNWLRKIEDLITSLSTMPERMTLVKEEPFRSEGVRKAIVDNFIVYFWIDEKSQLVQIIHIVYAKRNQLEQLRNIIKQEI